MLLEGVIGGYHRVNEVTTEFHARIDRHMAAIMYAAQALGTSSTFDYYNHILLATSSRVSSRNC